MATPLAAQVAPDSLPKDSSVTPLDALVVSTTRPIAITGGTSAVLVNPDSLHLAPAPTLEQVLRKLPFITVRENSRGQAELSVRGSESRQVAVLLDGIPLTMGWDHRTDPSIIPATGAQSIVLVRGLHSLLYGPNVLGGVVEVNVAHGPAPLQTMGGVQVRAGFNHLGGRTASATGNVPVALANGDLLVRAGAGHRARPGFALPAEVDDPGSDDPALRLNSHLRHTDAFLALRYHDFTGAWMGLSTSAFRAKRGVPPETHVFEPRLWRYPEDSRLLAVLSAGTGQRTTRFGAGDLEASLGVDIGATEIESFESLAYETVVGTESSDDRTLTLRLLGDHTLGSSTSLRGAVTLADISHGEVINGDEPADYRQRLWSLGVEATRAVWEGTHLSGGIVLDGADTPESGGKPPLERLWAWGGRLGASSLVAGGTVRLHGAVSRRARFPSLRELYSGALGSFVPNPDLQPETLVGMEAGATTRRAGIGLQAVLFHHRLSDAVVRASAGNRKFRRENRDEVRSTGLELLADWNGGRVSVTGDLMLQNVRIIDPGVAAGARRPEHMPGFRAGVNLNAPLPLELRGFASAKYIGDQFCIHPDLETTIELDGSPRGDLGVDRSWSLGRGGPFRTLRTTLALDNFTDTAIFDQCGLPQPGRTLRFGIEIG